MGIWILKIDNGGFKETEHLIPGIFASAFPTLTGLSIYVWPEDAVSSLFMIDFATHRQILVSTRATLDVPYNIDVSTDLKTWTPLVTGFFGDLEPKEPLGPNNRFYRVWEP